MPAGRQLQGGEGMAQVVEANRRQGGSAQKRLERQGRQVSAPQRLAGRVAEDEILVGQAARMRSPAPNASPAAVVLMVWT